MELAIHMKNDKTGEKRIKKTSGKSTSPSDWHCEDFYYGSDWDWKGTELWKDVCDNVEYIGKEYYKLKEEKKDGYKNPIPSLDDEQVGKEFLLRFTFEDYVSKKEAVNGINQYLENHGKISEKQLRFVGDVRLRLAAPEENERII